MVRRKVIRNHFETSVFWCDMGCMLCLLLWNHRHENKSKRLAMLTQGLEKNKGSFKLAAWSCDGKKKCNEMEKEVKRMWCFCRITWLRCVWLYAIFMYEYEQLFMHDYFFTWNCIRVYLGLCFCLSHLWNTEKKKG